MKAVLALGDPSTVDSQVWRLLSPSARVLEPNKRYRFACEFSGQSLAELRRALTGAFGFGDLRLWLPMQELPPDWPTDDVWRHNPRVFRGEATWTREATQIDDEELYLWVKERLAPSKPAPTTDDTTSSSSKTPPWLWGASAVLLLSTIGLGAYVLTRRAS
jgi:hypothetical protein